VFPTFVSEYIISIKFISLLASNSFITSSRCFGVRDDAIIRKFISVRGLPVGVVNPASDRKLINPCCVSKISSHSNFVRSDAAGLATGKQVDIYLNGKFVYHEGRNPTPAAVGAVNIAGDTMTGNLTVPAVLVSSAQNTSSNALTRKDYVDSEVAKLLARIVALESK